MTYSSILDVLYISVNYMPVTLWMAWKKYLFPRGRDLKKCVGRNQAMSDSYGNIIIRCRGFI